jgi:hypothetical protein
LGFEVISYDTVYWEVKDGVGGALDSVVNCFDECKDSVGDILMIKVNILAIGEELI